MSSLDWGMGREREFFIDNLLVRIHFIILMIRWTGLAPWEFEFPFVGRLISGEGQTRPGGDFKKRGHVSQRLQLLLHLSGIKHS